MNSTANTGALIKELRKQKKLTLAEIAEKADCTVSFLSKLENGHTKTSLNMLHRIANVLSVNINSLIPNDEEPTGPRIVRKKDHTLLYEGTVRNHDGVILEAVSHVKGDHSFQVNLHRVAPGASSDGQIVHIGEEFIYVLEGEVTLLLSDESHDLQPGDSAFFSSSEPHGYKNSGEREAVILWLNTPPTY